MEDHSSTEFESNMNNQIVLFLTSCVNPNGMPYTKLQNGDIRLKQYLEAIQFYLDNTPYRMIIVDNSDMDYSSRIQLIHRERVDFFAFDGNTEKMRGKGYNEAKILEYGIRNSKFVNDETLICKISGRYIISNINDILNHYGKMKLDRYFIGNIGIKRNIMGSVCFICKKDFLCDFFFKNVYLIDDNQGRYFEHVLAYSVQEYTKSFGKFVQIMYPFIFHGYSGTSNKELPKTKMKDYLFPYVKYILVKFNLLKCCSCIQ